VGVVNGGFVDSIKLEAPAKLNICLKVVGKRGDGYHELVSVMVPIDLTDTLGIHITRGGEIQIQCTGLDVPAGEDNLAYRAARAFLKQAGINKGLLIELHKRIPVAAGLGGGSSDAAAVLLGLNSIWPGRLNPNELELLALGLGADVPFFLKAVPSLATGIGEILKPLEKWPDLWYTLIKPPIGVSTAWVYGQLKYELTTRENDCIFGTLFEGADSVIHIMENDLESVTESQYPVIQSVKKILIGEGAEGALMTGSGPTVFGVFKTPESAKSAKNALISQGWGDVYVVADWKHNRYLTRPDH
jgi:4-diphosphocytidyl-2-C-methyl-D-erythritol kinase